VQGGATNSKLVRIADDKKSLVPSKRLWVMANWSRFVRPGAVRVGVSGGDGGMRVSAFRNLDGGVVVVVVQIGTGSGNVGLKVGGFDTGKVEAWVTDTSRDCMGLGVKVGTDGGVSVEVPGQSVVSIVLGVKG
jgi:O-glycosyl hydrolase